jgi:midasin
MIMILLSDCKMISQPLQMESVNLSTLQEFNFQYVKPTLWVYGGHPLVPSSCEIFYKLQEILAFCAVVWPRRNLLSGHLDGMC